MPKPGCNLLLDQFASSEQTGERITLYRSGLEAASHAFDPMRVAVARNFWVARDRADRDAAIERQAQMHRCPLVLSRGPESRPTSHILGYSDAPGAREAHSLIGTPDEIAEKLAALHAQERGLRAAQRPRLAGQSAGLRAGGHAGFRNKVTVSGPRGDQLRLRHCTRPFH